MALWSLAMMMSLPGTPELPPDISVRTPCSPCYTALHIIFTKHSPLGQIRTPWGLLGGAVTLVGKPSLSVSDLEGCVCVFNSTLGTFSSSLYFILWFPTKPSWKTSACHHFILPEVACTPRVSPASCKASRTLQRWRYVPVTMVTMLWHPSLPSLQVTCTSWCVARVTGVMSWTEWASWHSPVPSLVSPSWGCPLALPSVPPRHSNIHSKAEVFTLGYHDSPAWKLCSFAFKGQRRMEGRIWSPELYHCLGQQGLQLAYLSQYWALEVMKWVVIAFFWHLERPAEASWSSAMTGNPTAVSVTAFALPLHTLNSGAKCTAIIRNKNILPKT